MGKYTLFGKEVTFSKPAEEYATLQYLCDVSPSRKNGQKKVIKSREEKCGNQAAEEIRFFSKESGEIQPSAEWGRTVL